MNIKRIILIAAISSYVLFIGSCFGTLCFLGLNIPLSEAQSREFNRSIDAASTKILKEMDAYLNSNKAFSFHVDITDQYPSNTGEINEIKRSALITVRRPNRLKADVKIEDPETERSFYYNGETITLFDKTDNLYAQIQAPDTTAKALDFAMNELGFTFPLVDFVFKSLYENLTANVLNSDYLGIFKINGDKCHFLVFNQNAIDWYLWVDVGKKPVPRKFLIIYKNTPKKSKFIAEFTKHEVLKNLSDDSFNFKPFDGAEQIDFLLVSNDGNAEESDINNEAP